MVSFYATATSPVSAIEPSPRPSAAAWARSTSNAASEAAGRSRWWSRSWWWLSPAAPLRPSRQPCDSKFYHQSPHHGHRLPANRHGTAPPPASPVSRPAPQTHNLSRTMHVHVYRRITSSSANVDLLSLLFPLSPMLCLYVLSLPSVPSLSHVHPPVYLPFQLLLFLAVSATLRPPFSELWQLALTEASRYALHS